MVTAKEIHTQLGIPPYALYRLVAQDRVPYERVMQPWYKRPQYRFCVDAVRQALGMGPAGG